MDNDESQVFTNRTWEILSLSQIGTMLRDVASEISEKNV